MRIVHLADFHLPNDPAEILYGINPYLHLDTAVSVLQSLQPQPDLIVIGGDIFNDGADADYSVLQDSFSALKQPVHLVMGNHDHLAAYRRTAQPPPSPGFPGYYSFDFDGYHVVMLYSAGTGRGFGMLDEAQLQWLDDDLAQCHPRPSLIFAHHPPVRIGVPWLDSINLRNMDDFWAVAARYARQLCGIFVAHLHLQITCVHCGVLVASCPSTGWQFSGNSDSAKAERSGELPGFNLLDLADGQFSIRTVRFEPRESLHRSRGGGK